MLSLCVELVAAIVELDAEITLKINFQVSSIFGAVHRFVVLYLNFILLRVCKNDCGPFSVRTMSGWSTCLMDPKKRC